MSGLSLKSLSRGGGLLGSLDPSVVVLIVVVLAVVGLFLMKRLTMVPTDKARQMLARGGVVIDVRSASEYASDHLPQAVNIPINELADKIGKAVPDKSTPVLLHCLSGSRSAAGCNTLRDLGYTEVENLGSLGRARQVVGGK